ncbi:hypothetical protein Gohar_024808 [Gossypium harknessii]|uniref:RNase H type-1 domain-containing protein n=1 Tax=Gossypium harknessii TaxID=34285 RepID=A0A7J9HH74_9ROSI|nr:hypothetical protein [Gossypium harknessii]
MCVHEIVILGVAWARSFMSWNTTSLHSYPMVIGRCWLPSDRGWIKLNMDGAGSSNVSNACIGGVFRDSDANWLYDYSIVVGKDSTFRVEARAVLEELRIVWEWSFRQIDVECDNVLLVKNYFCQWSC